jgi:hypothetical protein
LTQKESLARAPANQSRATFYFVVMFNSSSSFLFSSATAANAANAAPGFPQHPDAGE